MNVPAKRILIQTVFSNSFSNKTDKKLICIELEYFYFSGPRLVVRESPLLSNNKRWCFVHTKKTLNVSAPKQNWSFWLLILMEDVARPSNALTAKIFKLLCLCFLLIYVDWSIVLFGFFWDYSSSLVPVCAGKLLIGLSWLEITDYGILSVVLLWWRLLKTQLKPQPHSFQN